MSLGAGSRGSVVEQQDLIHMADGLIVPVSRPRSVHWSGNMKTSWILFFFFENLQLVQEAYKGEIQCPGLPNQICF